MVGGRDRIEVNEWCRQKRTKKHIFLSPLRTGEYSPGKRNIEFGGFLPNCFKVFLSLSPTHAIVSVRFLVKFIMTFERVLVAILIEAKERGKNHSASKRICVKRDLHHDFP